MTYPAGGDCADIHERRGPAGGCAQGPAISNLSHGRSTEIDVSEATISDWFKGSTAGGHRGRAG